MRHFILLVLFIILGFTVWTANYVGFFKSVEIEEGKRGPYILLYKEHQGAYHKIVNVIKEVEQFANEKLVNCPDTFGEYLDNPETVEEGRLRSLGGCIIESFPSDLPSGYALKEIPEKTYVIANFEGSPGIGPFKVYPKVNDYIRMKRLAMSGSVIEIYHIDDPESDTGMTTTYLFQTEPIEKK
ncbi:MAG TPA: GyrI-like domain-containing protein [Pseudobdellovibrionaceae bacterium]|nr:GyrI-like domain-containing protein [Pseudobdellovibrionaceae bacterium]